MASNFICTTQHLPTQNVTSKQMKDEKKKLHTHAPDNKPILDQRSINRKCQGNLLRRKNCLKVRYESI